MTEDLKSISYKDRELISRRIEKLLSDKISLGRVRAIIESHNDCPSGWKDCFNKIKGALGI